jgi:hypothetical protein
MAKASFSPTRAITETSFYLIAKKKEIILQKNIVRNPIFFVLVYIDRSKK